MNVFSIPILLAAFVWTLPGAAQTLTPPSLSDNEIEARLDFLEQRLDASRRHGKYWQWGWMGASVAGLIGSSALAISHDGKEETADITNAVISGIGVVYLGVRPMEARLGADPIRALPGTTRAQKDARLRAAEALLQVNARRAEDRTDWRMYAGNAALHLLGGGAILAWGRHQDAAVTVASGLVAGSLQFWSQPSRPLSDWEAYRKRFGPSKSGGYDPEWLVVSNGRGIEVQYRF